ncbi:DNA topoisomerase large subunit [Trichinella spiralis]|uniref:DNA topoisomerase large subunit n=1 Tax=Trichinella spiralis TaxID=6334 RepID=A0ABR3KEY5_TRISP
MMCRCPENWYLVLPKKGIKLFALLLFLSAASVSVKNNLMTLDSRTKATWQVVSATPVGEENPKRYMVWLVELSP